METTEQQTPSLTFTERASALTEGAALLSAAAEAAPDHPLSRSQHTMGARVRTQEWHDAQHVAQRIAEATAGLSDLETLPEEPDGLEGSPIQVARIADAVLAVMGDAKPADGPAPRSEQARFQRWTVKREEAGAAAEALLSGLEHDLTQVSDRIAALTPPPPDPTPVLTVGGSQWPK